MVPLGPRLHGKTRRSRAPCLHGLIVVLLAMRLGGAAAPLFAAQAPAMPAPTVVASTQATEVTQRSSTAPELGGPWRDL
jgi:hypothetical protein